VRQQACVDASASRASPDNGQTETNIIKRMNADTAQNGLLDQYLTFPNGYGSAYATPTSTQAANNQISDSESVSDYKDFFPENSLCAYLPVPVSAASGLSTTVSRNSFDYYKTALDSGLEALQATGASVSAQALALKDLRNEARGAFQVYIPAGSLASRGSMDFTAVKVDKTAIQLLPTLTTSAIESYDTDVAVRLQPAGTTFSKPVTVCIFAGDTPESHFKYLSMAQQKDPGDPTKGFLYWETLFGRPSTRPRARCAARRRTSPSSRPSRAPSASR